MSHNPRKIERLVKAKKLATLTLIFLITLATLKYIIGRISGSVVLIADAVNSLSDTLMALAAFLSLRIILSRPNGSFPYGYYRFEDIISLLMAMGFLGLAIYIFSYGYYHAFVVSFEGSKDAPIAFATALVSGGLSLWFARKVIKVSKEAGLTSLGLSARDLKYDSLAAFSVAISIVLNRYYPIPFEAYASMGIGIMIAITALRGAKIAVLNLLDAWNKPEFIRKIRDIINSHQPLRAGRIRLRRCGPIIFGDAQIFAPEEIRLEDLDDILEEVEAKIYQAIPEMQDIVFEVEPLEETTIFCAVPVNETRGLESPIAESFEDARIFLIISVDTQNKKATIIDAIINQYIGKRNAAVRISKRLVQRGIDFVIVKDIGEVAFELLKAYSVDTYITDKDIIGEALDEFLQEKLRLIEEYSVLEKRVEAHPPEHLEQDRPLGGMDTTDVS